MPERGYQENFYTLYTKFRNHNTRLSKAKKVIYTLQNYSNRKLETLVCLDVGCSSGVITSYSAPFFLKMIGIDYDPVGLKLVTEEQKQAALFIRGDAMNLSLPDESVDAVICAQVYEHVPNDLRLFSEIERVLRPGGVVFFSGPNKVFPIELHYNLPFLHWFSEKYSDKYLQLMKKGKHFYERSRSPWNLRKVMKNFDVYDVTIPVVRLYTEEQPLTIRWLYFLLGRLPKLFWRLFVLFVPNINWVLQKKVDTNRESLYTLKP